jgi:hypothetical protein
MIMNQVAIAYRNESERASIKAMLGLTNAAWVKDTVTANVKVLGDDFILRNGVNVADLEFCMDMGGTQFELIKYTSGPNWIDVAQNQGVRMPMVAHVGFHLDEGEDWPPLAMYENTMVQEAFTISHTNEELNKAGRRYHYRIYRATNGTYFKFIKRLTVAAGEGEAK